MPKIYETLTWASSFLKKWNRDANAGEWLLMHQLDITRSQLFASLQDTIDDQVFNQFTINIKKHALEAVPIQHLIGYEMFYGRSFIVNENVLIPRPETEELIFHTLKNIKLSTHFSRKKTLTIADIGTGSGIIAITLALELKQINFTSLKIIATDISAKALEIAQINSSKYGISEINFIEGNLLQPLISQNIKVDILLSNPPYIPLSDQLSLSKVVLHDPALALFAGETGLDCYQNIIANLNQILSDDALVGFEVGAGQSEAVIKLLQQQFPTATTRVINDINGKDRMVFMEKYIKTIKIK